MQREYFYNSISINYQENNQYDVVIIGAGLSGLTAAFRLYQLKPNLTIKILEAKDRIGGRLFSTELPAANNTIDVWDLGGSWIGNKTIQPFINQLIAELNIKTYPQNFKGKKILESGNNFKVHVYNKLIPDIGLISFIDSSTLIKYVDNTHKKLFNQISSDSNVQEYYDSITLHTFLKEKTWTQSTSDCSKAAMRATFGSEPNKLSALYSLMYFNSCGTLMSLIESGESSCQGHKMIGGAQKICSRIIEIVGSDALELETVVTSILEVVNEKEDRYSIINSSTGNIYKAKHVILAIPPHFIPNIQFQPALSPTKYEFFSSSIPGHLIKVILTYENAFWLESGYSGEIVTNGGKSNTNGCSTGPLCVVFDATTNNNSPALIGLIGGQQAFEYEAKTKEERREAVLKSLETFFPNKDVRNFIVYSEKIWRQESFVGGCPMSIVPTGVGKHCNNLLRISEHGIHFAASELAKQWIGYMEGAVESGEKAALEIISSY